MTIVRALPSDAAALTAIAMAAKRHWGYPEHWLQAWRDALTLTPDYIAAHATLVAIVDEAKVGFSAIQLQTTEAALDHLWVLPSAMGRGVGRALFAAAEAAARAAGARRLILEGDPHAEGFYRRMGATVYGQRSSPIDGQARLLPLLEKAL